MPIKSTERDSINAAIAAGNAPRSAKGGRGLILSIPGARYKTIVNVQGKTTPFGDYYYSNVSAPPPNRGFDYAQKATRVGRRETIKLLDGTTAVARTWNPRKNEFTFTKTGKEYYQHHSDRWLVQLPAKIQLRRKNGSYYVRDEYLQSSAVGLGEIHLPSTMTEAQQRAEVKRQTDEFLSGLPTVAGGLSETIPGPHQVLMAGYETWLLDPDRPVLYDRQETFVAPDGEVSVQATLDRPLHHAKPWKFPGLYRCEGLAPEAFEETDGNCVPYQLHKLLKKRGRPIWTLDFVETLLREIAAELYPGDELYELLGEAGCTARMILELCKQQSITVHILWGETLIEAFVPEGKCQCSSVALTIHGDHAYFYADKKTKELIAKLPKSIPKVRPSTKVSITNREATPDAATWLPCPVLLAAYEDGKHYFALDLDRCENGKHYFAFDLDRIREKLHEEGVCPYVTLSGPTTINGLYLPWGFAPKNESDKAPGPVIHLKRPEFEVCLKFCKLISEDTGRVMTYRGESLGVVGAKAFELLTMGPKERPEITKEDRGAIAARQGGECARCGGPCDDVDHRVARSSFGKDDQANLEYLCVDCHTLKTYQERLSRVEDKNLVLSRFSRETYAAFVESAKPPQICCNLHDPKSDEAVWNVDIARCRRNGLAENVVDLPVFAPTDEIVATIPGELADYNWVESNCRSPFLALPYFGPGWYSKASCAFMLDHRIISFDDVKLAFTATTKVPASLLTGWMEKLEQLWTKAVKDSDSKITSKLCINAMAGIWSSLTHYSYNMRTSVDPTDVMFDGPVSVRKTPGGTAEGMHDYIMKVEQLKLCSMRPVHQICLEAERLNVARALYVIRHHCHPLRNQILSIQVDGIYYQPGKRAAKKIENDLSSITYGDLPRLREKYEGPELHKLVKGQRNLHGDRCRWPQSASTSTTRVYRVEEVEEATMPGGTLAFQEAARPIIEPLTWTILVEQPDSEDFYNETIREHVVQQGRSAFISGPPGVGKSWVLKKLKEDLEAKGEKVKVISLTHVAARNVFGKTAHSFVHRFIQYGRYKGYILIDEVSMMCLPLLAALETLSLSSCKIVCFGDWNQLPPINNTWRGQMVIPKLFEHSRLMKVWCESSMFVLTRCWRAKDDIPFFNWYTSIPRMTLQEAKESARARMSPNGRATGSCTDADWNLVISHYRRIKLNDLLQKAATQAYKTKGGRTIVHIEPPEVKTEAGRCLMSPSGAEPGRKPLRNVPQAFDCWSGTRLIGADNEHKKIVNGALLEVLDIDPKKKKGVLVHDRETKKEFSMTIAQVAKHTRLCWAVTYPAVQGRTLDGTVRLWDIDSKHFTLEALYVGVSRATHGSLVSLAA